MYSSQGIATTGRNEVRHQIRIGTLDHHRKVFTVVSRECLARLFICLINFNPFIYLLHLRSSLSHSDSRMLDVGF